MKLIKVITNNPKGKLHADVYPSINGEFRWRTKSRHNGKITANGGESFKRKAGALKGLMLHAGEVNEIKIWSK